FDDVPTLVKPLVFPMSATISAFIVEYGLVNERWWMPRVQTIEGRARIGPTHATFSVEQSFRYASVNIADSLPAIAVTAMSDSAREARRDSIRAARRRAPDRDPDSVRHGGARAFAGVAAVDLRCGGGDVRRARPRRGAQVAWVRRAA